MDCARKSDRELILDVLTKPLVKNHTGAIQTKNPSKHAASTFGPDVSLVRNVAVPPNCDLISPLILIMYFFAMKFRGKEFGNKKGVVKDSFDPASIHLRQTTRRRAANKLQDDKEDKGGRSTQSSAQKTGLEIHQSFKNIINNKGTGDATTNEMLKKMKHKFGCEFMQAEVSISGYAVKRKTEVHFWSGRMDAVAIRRKNGDLEVFVVDWKTIDKTNVQIDWWEKAGNFKKALYQCLVF